MQFFGYDINIQKKQAPKQQVKEKKWFSWYSSYGFEMFGWSLNKCGDVQFSLNSFYTIQTVSTEATAYKNFITNRFGDLYLEDENGEEIREGEEVQKIQDLFVDPTYASFKDKFLTHQLCAGEVFLYPAQTMTEENYVQIVDPRTIQKELNKKWEVERFREVAFLNSYKTRLFGLDEIYNRILRYNPNSPAYGLSAYYPILRDALSDAESARRNYAFFKNNAVPDSVFMLEPWLSDEELKEFKEQVEKKYGGSENAHQTMLSWAVKDIKTLDVTNKDIELIQLREFIVKKMWVVFNIDPRIIGFSQAQWADRSIKEIREQANDVIHNMGQQFEQVLNDFYKTFIDVEFDKKIRVDTKSFSDEEANEQRIQEKVNNWLMTINEARQELGREEYDSDIAGQPLIKNDTILLDSVGFVNTWDVDNE